MKRNNFKLPTIKIWKDTDSTLVKVGKTALVAAALTTILIAITKALTPEIGEEYV